MTTADAFVGWVAINAACLCVVAIWGVRTGRRDVIDPWSAAILLPIFCALGVGVLLLGYLTYLSILYLWDCWLLKLVGWLIRAIPRNPESQLQRKLLHWSTTRLSRHVHKWLRPEGD